MSSSERGWVVFFQAEDGIRDLVRSSGFGYFYKQKTAYGIRLSLVGSEMCIRNGCVVCCVLCVVCCVLCVVCRVLCAVCCVLSLIHT